MEQKSMTALVSAFARAYHSVSNDVKVFDDNVAKQLLSEQEYNGIAENMTQGIAYFNPDFQGNGEEALRWIVDHQLSPTPLGRAAFAEKALEVAVHNGVGQYLIFAAGYDTFAYRQKDWAKSLQIFELDHPASAQDKLKRLHSADIADPDNVHFMEADFTQTDWQNKLTGSPVFDREKLSFCSLLGLSYYLAKNAFADLLAVINTLITKGSSVVFDYPDEDTYTDGAGKQVSKMVAMANASKEKMQAGYSYRELEKLLRDNGFLIYEHLTPEEITGQYFEAYNVANPDHRMKAFDHVNYCFAVKR